MNQSCLRPQIEDNFDTCSDYLIRNNKRYKYRRITDEDDLSTYSNKSYSFNSKKNFKLPSYIDKVKTIQKYVRFCLAIKKFNERIDLLTNILELDSTVNLIKDEKIEKSLLSNNAGEQLCNLLIQQKKILPYESTRYYRLNIRKYNPNKYLIKTPLTYIDKYKNNDLYKGTWTLEKKFHGYGVYYTSGNKYEGFWNFGKLIGEARKFYQNKDYFIGTFNENGLNSIGKYYHNDGTTYEGNWYKDQPHGKGKEIFADGSRFEGLFENGFKKKGRFTWTDGSYYEGEIKNNFFEGYGKFRWREGREYIGQWKNGKMEGKGIMRYVDGAKYEGEFYQGKRHGKGNYFWNKNKYYKGNWYKGKQEGDGYYYNQGTGIIGVWYNGKIKQCLSQESNSSINRNDSMNLSTNLSNRSMKDVRINNQRFNDNISYRSNKTETDHKKYFQKNQSTKSIHNKKSMTNLSIISDYSTSKNKITNIDVLFRNNTCGNYLTNKKNNYNNNSTNYIYSNNNSCNKIWKNSGYYRKYKNNKK